MSGICYAAFPQVYEYVYFGNSFFVAMVVFAAWQHESRDWVFLDCPLWAVLLLLGVSLAVLLHSALRVMPLYALIQPIGSHCPDDVLRIAKKQQAKAEEAKAARQTRGGSRGVSKHGLGTAYGLGLSSMHSVAGHGRLSSVPGALHVTPRKVVDQWLAHHVMVSGEHTTSFWKEQVWEDKAMRRST